MVKDLSTEEARRLRRLCLKTKIQVDDDTLNTDTTGLMVIFLLRHDTSAAFLANSSQKLVAEPLTPTFKPFAGAAVPRSTSF